jgi:putative phosphoesterase
MRIGIVSDTHSRYETIRKTVHLLQEHEVSCVLHCGDIEDEETVRLFSALPMHFVFGNCDDARDRLRAVMQECGATIQEPFGHIELEGIKIAFIHGDDKRLFRDVEHSGHFDFLFYGHTHQAETHRTGPTRVINPGALHRARPKTFVLLDLPSGDLQSIVVE